jgi:type II restriction/modification system DNA methylase subunit YeeA
MGEHGLKLRRATAPAESLHRYAACRQTSVVYLAARNQRFLIPDKMLIAIARSDDDATFGILHSRFHELWALAARSWHGLGNDPPPLQPDHSCFETFPFPDWPDSRTFPQADYAHSSPASTRGFTSPKPPAH